MDNGHILIKNISETKMNLVKNSVFKDTQSLRKLLENYEEEKRFEKFQDEIYKLDQIIYANIRELHENLEVFYTDTEEFLAARKEANKEFKEHMDLFYEDEFIKNMLDAEQTKKNKELEEKDRIVTVKGVEYEVVKRIDVLWSGWECDEYAYAVKTVDGVKLVVSNHGEMYFENARFLEDKITEYKKSIAESEELMKLIN